MVSGDSRNRQTRGGRSGQCFLPMRGGFGYADSLGSLPHITQFANRRKARRAAARF
jgi:hypothetical protein